MTDILVTGGCGYIGSRLVPLLASDQEVNRIVVLDNLDTGSPRSLFGSLDKTVEFRQGDVREYGDVESAMRGVDRVVHLAAITGATSTHERPEETRAVNCGGSENVLRAAIKLDIDTVVFASSCNIYGRATSTHLDETTDPVPINPYAEAKLEAEQLVSEYCDGRDLQGIVLRMSTNYGTAPAVRFNLVVNKFVFRALTDRPLTVYGDGNNWRPFIHVEDAARAYRHAVVKPGNWTKQIYNVGSTEENYRIAEIADIISDEVASVNVTYLQDRNPGPSYHVSFDRVEETGFSPEWSLEQGVRDLAAAFHSNDE